MTIEFSLADWQLHVAEIWRNAPPPVLYEHAIRFDGGRVTVSGAIASDSGAKTGRSPKDKRIVEHPQSRDDIWWGPVNIAAGEGGFHACRARALEFLNAQPRLYVFDGYAGWDPEYRLKIRVICSRPYHALFMHNMLIRPTAEELLEFDEPDYVIFNAGCHPADPAAPDVTSGTSVMLNLEAQEIVILGTEYAGEMKKGVFTLMNYLMPRGGVLSMHCSANEGEEGDVSLFFGLSGTGKTTLSADPRRNLIGDDEHCWSERGVFNIEGGCYAKCINLSPEGEPEIFRAIRFGALLENTTVDEETREVDFTDSSRTENTRVSYPLEFIPNAKTPAVGGHPANVILLTCDAFGVLPPVSLLTPEQAMYHFISGYTAKVAGTEMGVTEPEATFSACFGAAFMVWHPTRYAEMLAELMRLHHAQAWLVNTGWSGGPFGVGGRIKLAYTRAIIDGIHDHSLLEIDTVEDPIFGFAIPTRCKGVPTTMLTPRKTWADPAEYDAAALRLAELFEKNFRQYADQASETLLAAGPRLAR